jgi:hypothetical protein
MSSPARFQIARGSKATQRFGLAIAGLILAVPVGLILFLLPHGAVSFATSPEGLRITGDPYGQFIARKDMILSEARPLNLDSEPGYTPTRRTNGIGLPGYRSGWFDTQGAGKALLFVSDWANAVLIPTTLGYSLIVSPEGRDMMLDDLKRVIGNAHDYPLAPSDPAEGSLLGLAAFWGLVVGVPLVVGVLLMVLCVGTRRVVFEVTDDALRVRGDLFGRTIPRALLRLDEARVVDLKTGPDRMTLFRTMGVGLPGYLSGWVRALRHKEKFLVFLTDRSRVVRIPTSAGYTLLLTPAAPDSFLAALGVPDIRPTNLNAQI